MQIFKCLKTKKAAQNLVEFAFIFPILIVITLVVFEVAMYWQDSNAINNLNSEINANIALEDYSTMNIGDTCIGAEKALEMLEKKDSMISMNNPTYEKTIIEGVEPFALYMYSANPISTKSGISPQISMIVDCRNPFEEGVSTQLEFYHKNLIIKASIPRYDSPEPIVIIPEQTFIASPKLNTLRGY